jgi:RNA polymerase sigma factor (sigma-70 family)
LPYNRYEVNFLEKQSGDSQLEISDYELVEKCLNGDKEVFSELVARYKKLIFSVVYNMLPDKQEVNDVSQEVFIRLYKNLNRYNSEYKFSTWAVRIATNLCLDILRKKKVDSIPVDEIEAMPDSIGTPEERYISKERKERIKKAVDELPDKYRIPIILFHENGLSYEEMCNILNEPMTIIKNRLYRARLMLREKLLPERKEEAL